MFIKNERKKLVPKKVNVTFLRKKSVPERLERVLKGIDRSVLECVPEKLERFFFLKKGHSLFWNAFSSVLFYEHFSLGNVCAFSKIFRKSTLLAETCGRMIWKNLFKLNYFLTMRKITLLTICLSTLVFVLMKQLLINKLSSSDKTNCIGKIIRQQKIIFHSEDKIIKNITLI